MGKSKDIPIQIELNRCPTGCCLTAAIRSQTGDELRVEDVITMLGLLGKVFEDKGLPPKPPMPEPEPEGKKGGKLALVH